MNQFFSRKGIQEETDYFYSLVAEQDQPTTPTTLDTETRQIIEQMAAFQGNSMKVSPEGLDAAQKRVWQQLAAKFNLEETAAPMQPSQILVKKKAMPNGLVKPLKVLPYQEWSWPRVLVGGLALVTFLGIATLVLIIAVSIRSPKQDEPRSQLYPGTLNTPAPTAALPPTVPAEYFTVTARSTVPVTAKPTVTPTPRINAYTSIPLSGFSGPVTQVVWSPDGKFFAASSNKDPVVRVWKLGETPEQTTLLAALQGHQGGVLSLAWSPDGKVLATGSTDRTIKIWNMPGGTLLKTLDTPENGSVQALAFAPNGKTLASAYQRNPLNVLITFWNTSGWAATKTLDSGTNFFQAYNLQWSPDGAYLAGGMALYKLWRADGTEVGIAYNGGAPAWGLAWSPDSQRFAIASESAVIYFYDIAVKELGYLQAGNGDWLAWSPDGKILASGQYGISFTRAENQSFTEADILKKGAVPGSGVMAVGWSPDGKILAAGGARNYGVSAGSNDNTLTLWDSQGQITDILQGHTNQINVVAWSPVGRMLVSGSEDKTVRLWSIKP